MTQNLTFSFVVSVRYARIQKRLNLEKKRLNLEVDVEKAHKGKRNK